MREEWLNRNPPPGDGIVVDRDQSSDRTVNEQVFSGGVPYDGGFAIKTVLSPTSFTCEMAGSPTENAAPTALQIISRWQVGTLLAYRNIFELRDNRQASMASDSVPIGVAMAGNGWVPPYTFRQLVLRGNLIRKLDGAGNPVLDGHIIGVQLWSCENALVSGNVMDLTRTDLLTQFRCGTVSYFNNQYQSGLPVQGYVGGGQPHFVNEVHVDAAFAALRAT